MKEAAEEVEIEADQKEEGEAHEVQPMNNPSFVTLLRIAMLQQQ